MIQEILDYLWPEYCACGEKKIAGKCALDVEIGDVAALGQERPK